MLLCLILINLHIKQNIYLHINKNEIIQTERIFIKNVRLFLIRMIY